MDILGKERLHDIGFDIPRGKLMARQAVMLNRVEEELPSASDVAKQMTSRFKKSSNVLHSRALVSWMCSTSVLPSDGNYILKFFGTKRLYK